MALVTEVRERKGGKVFMLVVWVQRGEEREEKCFCKLWECGGTFSLPGTVVGCWLMKLGIIPLVIKNEWNVYCYCWSGFLCRRHTNTHMQSLVFVSLVSVKTTYKLIHTHTHTIDTNTAQVSQIIDLSMQKYWCYEPNSGSFPGCFIQPGTQEWDHTFCVQM